MCHTPPSNVLFSFLPIDKGAGKQYNKTNKSIKGAFDMSARRVLVTGSRGGCGKSSVAAGVAWALALAGQKTALIDLDLAERSLDMYLGCEDRVVYDLGDLLVGQTRVRDVALCPEGADGLYLIPGAYHLRRPPTKEETERVFSAVESELGVSYLIVDTSSAADPSVKLSAGLCHEGIMVVCDSPLSLRSAASLMDTLHEFGMDDVRMVVNRFSMDPKKPTDLRAMIDATGMRLLGVVPECSVFAREQDAGVSALRAKACPGVACALSNIAARLTGEHRPLLTGISCRRKKLLDI